MDVRGRATQEQMPREDLVEFLVINPPRSPFIKGGCC